MQKIKLFLIIWLIILFSFAINTAYSSDQYKKTIIENSIIKSISYNNKNKEALININWKNYHFCNLSNYQFDKFKKSNYSLSFFKKNIKSKLCLNKNTYSNIIINFFTWLLIIIVLFIFIKKKHNKKIKEKVKTNHKLNWKLISTTNISSIFNISNKNVVNALSDLWLLIIKWPCINKITEKWKQFWWHEFYDKHSWNLYIKWPEWILEDKDLISILWTPNYSNTASKTISNISNKINQNAIFRTDNKWKDSNLFKTDDWHIVRSRWEKIIDDLLYKYWILHEYETRVVDITERTVLCDFYIPLENWWVYIEYWWMNTEKYLKNKKEKKELYKKYSLNLIEIENININNISDYLLPILSKYWIVIRK